MQIIEHIGRGDTKDFDASVGQPFIARLIALGTATEIVTDAVYLKPKLCLGGEKVDYVRASRMLATELKSGRPLPQFPPDEDFGEGHFPPQPSRTSHRLFRAFQHRAFPSTTLRVVPLPVPGRNDI